MTDKVSNHIAPNSDPQRHAVPAVPVNTAFPLPNGPAVAGTPTNYAPQTGAITDAFAGLPGKR